MKQTRSALTMLLNAYKSVFKSAWLKGATAAVVLTAGLSAGSATAASDPVKWDEAQAGAGTITINNVTDVTKTLNVSAGDVFTVSSGDALTLQVSGDADPVGINVMEGGTLKVGDSSKAVTLSGLTDDININGTVDVGASGGSASGAVTTLKNAYVDGSKAVVNIYSGGTFGSQTEKLTDAEGTENVAFDKAASGAVLFTNGATLNAQDGETTLKGAEIHFDAGTHLNVYGTLTLSGDTVIADSVLKAQANDAILKVASGDSLSIGLSDLASFRTQDKSNSNAQGSIDLTAGGNVLTVTGTSAEKQLELNADMFSGAATGGKIGVSGSTVKADYITAKAALGQADELTLNADSLTLGDSTKTVENYNFQFKDAVVGSALKLNANSGDTAFVLNNNITLDNKDSATVGKVDGNLSLTSGGTLTVQGKWEAGDLTLSSSTLALNTADVTEDENNVTNLAVKGTLDAKSDVTLSASSATADAATVDLTAATFKAPTDNNVLVTVQSGASVEMTSAQMEAQLGRDRANGFTFKADNLGSIVIDASAGALDITASNLSGSAAATDKKIGIASGGVLTVNGDLNLSYNNASGTASVDDNGSVNVNGNLIIATTESGETKNALTLGDGNFNINNGNLSADNGLIISSAKLTLNDSAASKVSSLTLSGGTAGKDRLVLNNSTLDVSGKLLSNSGSVVLDKGSKLTVQSVQFEQNNDKVNVSGGSTFTIAGDGKTNTQEISIVSGSNITVDATSTVDLGKIADTMGVKGFTSDSTVKVSYNNSGSSSTALTNPFNSKSIEAKATSDILVDLTGLEGITADTKLTDAQVKALKTEILGADADALLTIKGATIALKDADKNTGYYSFADNADALKSATDANIKSSSFTVTQAYNKDHGVFGDVGTVALEATANKDGEVISAFEPENYTLNIAKGLTLNGDSKLSDNVLTAVVAKYSSGEDTVVTRYVAGVSGANGAAADLQVNVADAQIGDVADDVNVITAKNLTVLKAGQKVSDVFTKKGTVADGMYGDFGSSDGATITSTEAGTYTAANFVLTEVDSMADGSTVIAVADKDGNSGAITIKGNRDTDDNGNPVVNFQDKTFIGSTFTAEKAFKLGQNGRIDVSGDVKFSGDTVNLGDVVGGELTLEQNVALTIGQVAASVTDEPAVAAAREAVSADQTISGWQQNTSVKFESGSSLTVANGAFAIGAIEDEADNKAGMFALMAQHGAKTGLYVDYDYVDNSTTGHIDTSASGALIVGDYKLAEGVTAYSDKQMYFGDNSLTVIDGSGTSSSNAALKAEAVNLQGNAKLVLANVGVDTKIVDGDINTDAEGGYDVHGTGAWAGDNVFMSNGFLDLDSSDGLTVVAADDDVAHSRYSKLTADEFAYFKDVALNSSYAYDNEFVSDIINSAMSYNDQAKSFDSLGRIVMAGGVFQSSLLASKTTTDAIAQRTGVGSTGNIATVSAQTAAGASVWLTPIYANSDSDSFDAGAFEYGSDVDLTGAALGVDYTSAQGFTVGVAMNVGSGDADSQGDLADTSNDFDYFGFGVYGAYEIGAFKLAADMGYTFLSSDIDQNNAMGKFTTDTDSSVATFGLAAKYTFDLGMVDVAPHVGIRYLHVNTDDYDVVGGDYGMLMHGDSITADIVQFPIGVTFSSEFVASDWTVKPALDLSVIPATGDTDVDSDVYFDDRHLGYNTDVASDCTYGVTLGVEAAYGNAAFGVGYSYFGSSDEDAQSVVLNGRYTF